MNPVLGGWYTGKPRCGDTAAGGISGCVLVNTFICWKYWGCGNPHRDLDGGSCLLVDVVREPCLWVGLNEHMRLVQLNP